MRFHRLRNGEATVLVAETADGYYNMTETAEQVRSFTDLAKAARISDLDIDELSRAICAEAPAIDHETVAEDAIIPIIPDEIWGSGVTYPISQEARKEGGSIPDMYSRIYSSDRPEIYFKATPSRTVGPNEPVGIRGDSNWDVPEPELAIILLDGEIVGYTIGNDMCSWELERENALYLPQSKMYKRCCAVGPCVATVADPHALDMRMRVVRDGHPVLEDTASTAEMVRTCDELVSYFNRHNEVPEVTVFLTGTSLMAPDDFSLEEGDTIHIDIDEIGTLTNDVITV